MRAEDDLVFPADFARRVIGRARYERRRRWAVIGGALVFCAGLGLWQGSSLRPSATAQAQVAPSTAALWGGSTLCSGASGEGEGGGTVEPIRARWSLSGGARQTIFQ
jgi:hypothetical protein